jgi:hypothetical protein
MSPHFVKTSFHLFSHAFFVRAVPIYVPMNAIRLAQLLKKV